jgi:HK97 family phage major capsid protein
VPYNSLTDRTEAAALIPEEVVDTIMTKATEQSAVLSLFRRIPVSRAQLRIPVLSALPSAYWVTGDTGLKQTTELAWASKYLNIEEIAVIVPIPQNVLDDADYDIWGESMPLLTERVARTFDSAVFFGTNAPASFPTDVVASATAAGNTVAEGTATTAEGGFMGDVDALIATLEADGYDVDGYVADRSARAKFRSARNTSGDRVDRDRVSGGLDEFDGDPVAYTMRGLWPADVRMIAGQFSDQFVVGVRKDVTMDISTEAVISDANGAIIYNLFQQDMVALRLTFRAGWQVANVINDSQPTEASRYPASVLTYSAGGSV